MMMAVVAAVACGETSRPRPTTPAADGGLVDASTTVDGSVPADASLSEETRACSVQCLCLYWTNPGACVDPEHNTEILCTGEPFTESFCCGCTCAPCGEFQPTTACVPDDPTYQSKWLRAGACYRREATCNASKDDEVADCKAACGDSEGAAHLRLRARCERTRGACVEAVTARIGVCDGDFSTEYGECDDANRAAGCPR